MEVILSLINGELYHSYAKSVAKRGGEPYSDHRFRDAINWFFPYVEAVLKRQCEAEHARMQVAPAYPLNRLWALPVSSSLFHRIGSLRTRFRSAFYTPAATLQRAPRGSRVPPRPPHPARPVDRKQKRSITHPGNG